MSASRLIKVAPTTILVAFLGYACFSLQSALPGAAAEQSALEKGFDLMLQDLATSGTGATATLGQMRNPFLVVVPPKEATAAEPEAAAEPETDKLAEIISGLTLDATFIQGHDQLAIINGRIYHKGQSLALPGDPEKTQGPVVVLFVKPNGVLLRGGGRNYSLGYPERLGKKPDTGADDPSQADTAMLDPAGQAAMFQRLLSSPLGALGKSLIGNAVPTKRSGRSRPGARAKNVGTRPPGPPSP